MISVQSKDFSVSDEISKLNQKYSNIGAISSFIGIVRNKRADQELISMTLEHYPNMAIKMLENIRTEAMKRWELLEATIIHRYGKLYPGDQIVLVITVSKHRKEAIESCHFLIDWLKTKGPFWKFEKTKTDGFWVDAQEEDLLEEKKWETTS